MRRRSRPSAASVARPQGDVVAKAVLADEVALGVFENEGNGGDAGVQVRSKVGSVITK